MVWGTTPSPQPVILRPRPLQPDAGSFLLVPLLPYTKTTPPLPAELWTEIFSHVYYGEDNVDPTSNFLRRAGKYRYDLLLVCRALTNIALPVFYSRVWLRSPSQLEKFTTKLHDADRQWDSLRRIPYSVPGRWVQRLDLSGLNCGCASLTVDELLARLFPLLPFMATLVLNTDMKLSKRALAALTFRDGIEHLKSLKGIRAPITDSLNQTYYPASAVDDDPLVQLIRKATNLEDIEIYGPGVDSPEVDFSFQAAGDLHEKSIPQIRNPLILNNLRRLSMLSTHASSFMFFLLSSELSSLKRLVVTPCDDLPYPTSLVSKFIQVHGSTLRFLHFSAPKDRWWVSRPSPQDVLLMCPNLTHLSLGFPLPALKIPQGDAHPLELLSIPRPNQHCYDIVHTIVSSLKNLRAVRTRDVRWSRRGITSQAKETIIQGEMRKWKRSLSLLGVVLIDTDMNREED